MKQTDYKNWKKRFASVCLSCILGSAWMLPLQADAAGSAESQLSLLAGKRNVWNTGSFYTEWKQDKGMCAVTDLDGNGRLELVFLRYVRKPLPYANPNGSNEERGRSLVVSVPVTVQVRAFEVSADGKNLEELKFNYQDKAVPPDLAQLWQGFYYADDKIRSYRVSTLNRAGELGYSLYEQVVSLQNGTVEVQTLGTKHGNYGLFSEAPTAEAIPDYAESRSGEKIQETELDDYANTYMAGTEPAYARAGWIFAEDWQKIRENPNDLYDAFAASWEEFRFELKKQP